MNATTASSSQINAYTSENHKRPLHFTAVRVAGSGPALIKTSDNQ